MDKHSRRPSINLRGLRASDVRHARFRIKTSNALSRCISQFFPRLLLVASGMPATTAHFNGVSGLQIAPSSCCATLGGNETDWEIRDNLEFDYTETIIQANIIPVFFPINRTCWRAIPFLNDRFVNILSTPRARSVTQLQFA